MLPLRPYQQEALQFFRSTPSHSGLLAYDVGTGKTLIALALSELLSPTARILFLVPNTLKYSTAEEIRKWLPTSSISVIDGPPLIRKIQWASPARFTITNYETLLRDPQPFSHPWDLVIADEATRISNPRAKTTRAAARLASPRRIAMTGTPISNSPLELWSILSWCKPGCLGQYWPFMMRYCVRNQWNAVTSYVNLDELATRIAPHMIRRTKEEVLTELPPRVTTDIYVELDKDERKLYDQIRRELVLELGHLKVSLATLGNAIVRMVRLRQITGSPALVGIPSDTPSSKIEALMELLATITASSDEKVIVFTSFASLVPLLENYLNEYQPALIMGELSPESRQASVTRFQKDPKCRVLLSTEAGGEGLNLQAANHVIHFDLPFSIAKMTQRVGRAHRMGQERTVFEYRLLARKTIDEHVKRILTRKGALSSALLSADVPVTAQDIEEILTS